MNKIASSGIIFLARECAMRCRTFRLRYDVAVQQFPRRRKMNTHSKLFCAAALAGFAFAAASPAQALTAQECSAKYQAAKKDGSLGGQKWNDFRKAQCGADATPAPTAAAPAPAPAAPKEASKDTTKQAKKEAAPAAAPAAPAGPAVFPNAV